MLLFDGDSLDRTCLVPTVLAPVRDETADFAIGSRLRGNAIGEVWRLLIS